MKYVDPDGNALHVAIGAGIGALVGGLSSALAGGSLKEVAAAAVGGAVAGGMAAATCGISLGASIAGSAMAGTAGYLAESMITGNQATIEGAVIEGMSGAAGYMVGTFIGKGLSTTISKPSASVPSTETKSVIYVTKDGVALPPGKNIPSNLVENKFRSGSYGEIKDGKFKEVLRIDSATPRGKKGPEYSHFHINGEHEHIIDFNRWPEE